MDTLKAEMRYIFSEDVIVAASGVAHVTRWAVAPCSGYVLGGLYFIHIQN